jgi:hypothetical protein
MGRSSEQADDVSADRQGAEAGAGGGLIASPGELVLVTDLNAASSQLQMNCKDASAGQLGHALGNAIATLWNLVYKLEQQIRETNSAEEADWFIQKLKDETTQFQTGLEGFKNKLPPKEPGSLKYVSSTRYGPPHAGIKRCARRQFRRYLQLHLPPGPPVRAGPPSGSLGRGSRAGNPALRRRPLVPRPE